MTNEALAAAAVVYARMIYADLERARQGDFTALVSAGIAASHFAGLTPSAGLVQAAWRKACQEPPARA